MAESPIPAALSALLSPSLPAPLKALAGLAVTAIEDARHLPAKVGELPTTVLTTLATGSMRVQQQYAEWVAKGEEFIGALRQPQPDAPAWATFDEDLPPADPKQSPVEAGSSASSRVSNGLGPGSAFDLQDADDLPVARRRAPAKKVGPAKKTAPAKKVAPAKKAAPVKKSAPAAKKSAPAPAKKTTPATSAGPASATPGSAQATTPSPATVPATSGPSTSGPASGSDGPAGDPSTPQSLPDFDSLTIPQLRSRLKTLKLAEVQELIAYEQAATNRPAVVQMLRARVEILQK